jgi:DNA-directed RNA polymerase subunit RPC12/RpoP
MDKVECKECGKEMYDLTHGRGEKRNYICHRCGAHLWDGKWYTLEEWEAYVNEEPT